MSPFPCPFTLSPPSLSFPLLPVLLPGQLLAAPRTEDDLDEGLFDLALFLVPEVELVRRESPVDERLRVVVAVFSLIIGRGRAGRKVMSTVQRSAS